MEQVAGVTENPIVTLKNGHKVSRFLVNQVMDMVEKMQEEKPNGLILLNDLIMKCRDANHRFFCGTQWKLAELGFLETDGLVKPSMREIILASATGNGCELDFRLLLGSN